MTDYAKLMKRTALVYVLSYLILPVNFLIRAIFARQLSIVDYGIFFGLFAFFGFFSILRDWGFGVTSTYFVNKYLEKKEFSKVKAVYYLNVLFQLGTSLLLSIILLFSREFILTAVYKNEGHVSFMFDFFVVYWVIETVYTAITSFFNSFHEQHIAKGFEFINRLLILFCVLVGFELFSPYKVPIYSYMSVLLLITIASAIVLVVRHKNVFQTAIYKGVDLLREVLRYATLALFGSISSIFLVQMDTFLVQLFLGAENVSYYVSGYSAAEIIMLLIAPLTLITASLFARLWHGKKLEELARILNLILNLLPVVLFPIAVFFVVYADKVIYFIYGPLFYSSAIIMQLFCISAVVKMYTTFFYQVVTNMGDVWYASKVNIVCGVLNIILCIILIPVLGLQGAVISVMVVYVLIFILLYHRIRKKVSLHFEKRNLVIISCSSLIFGGVVYFLSRYVTVVDVGRTNWNYFLNGIVYFVLGFLVYASILYSLKIITKKKIIYVMRLSGVSWFK